jgi:hypothetical protein
VIETHTALGVDSRRAVTELVEDLQLRICAGAGVVEREAAAARSRRNRAPRRRSHKIVGNARAKARSIGGWGSTRVLAAAPHSRRAASTCRS